MVNPLAYAAAGALTGLGEGMAESASRLEQEAIRAREARRQAAMQAERDQAQNEFRAEENALNREHQAGLQTERLDRDDERARLDREAADARSRRSGLGTAKGRWTTLDDGRAGYVQMIGGKPVFVPATDAEGNPISAGAGGGSGMKDDLARLRAFESTAQAIFDNAEAQSMEEAHQLAQERLGFGIGDLNLAPQRGGGARSTGGGGASSAPDARADLPYPPKAMKILLDTPSPQMKALFDRRFGAGAADKVLGQ